MQNTSIIDLFLLSSLFVKVLTVGLIISSIWSWGFLIKKTLDMRKINSICTSLEHSLLRSTSINGFLNTTMSMRDDLTVELNSTIATLYEKNLLSKITPCVEHILYQSSTDLRKGIDSLASIGSISPFVGLLGTVWGIMSSFRSMIDDASNIASIAPGIAESLLATAIGLIVAIPANIAYNKIITQMDKVDERYELILNKIKNLTLNGNE